MITLQPVDIHRAAAAAPSKPWPRLSPAATSLAGRATLAAPLIVGAVGGVLLASVSNAVRRVGMALLGLSVGGAIARWQLGRAFAWQPPYQVEFDDGRLQIRRYAPQIHAESVVVGQPWADALDEGFVRLAAYISGENDAKRRIAMSSPVLMSVPAAGARDRRDMSWLPPSVAQLGELKGAASSRCMAFVMPNNLPLDMLPLPNDRRVLLRGVPRRRMAALRFSGTYAGDLPAEKRNELLFLVKSAGLKPASEVWFAGYDGPTTLPLLRHNEVLVEIRE